MRPLECIIIPITDDFWEETDASSNTNAIPIYKESESREAEMDPDGKVKIADEDASKRDQREKVEVAEKYKQSRQSFVQILEEFRTMQDGHL